MTGQASFGSVADVISIASFIIESHIIKRSRNDSRGVAQPGSAPALGAEKFFPEGPSRIVVSIVYNNLGNLLLVQG